MVKHLGIRYIDSTEVQQMSNTDKGKKQLAKYASDGEGFQTLRWVFQNPIGRPNRAARRRKNHGPLFGLQKNNSQDRTKHKVFG